MAHIGKNKKTSAWVVRWRNAAGRQNGKSFKRKADATRFASQIEQERRTGGAANPTLGKTTVAQVVNDWRVQAVHLKPSTLCRYEAILRNHILPAFGTMAIADLKRPLIATWVREMSATHKPSSVRQSLRLLSTICEVAVNDERIAKNPCQAVKPPRLNQEPVKALPWADVEALATQGGHIADDIRFLAATGLRFGEFAGLRVGDVDQIRRRVQVTRSVTDVGGKPVTTSTKTGKTRVIVVPEFVWPAIAARCAGRRAHEPLFRSPKGHPVRPRNWRRSWDRACQLAGVVAHPHMLRHTAATLAIRGGASVKTVQAMLGHSSAAMTLDVYASWFPDDLDAAAEALTVASGATSCSIFVPFRQEAVMGVLSIVGASPLVSVDSKVGGGGVSCFLL